MIILSKKIFKYIMLVSSMVTVLGLAFVIGILSHSFQHQLMNELKKEAVYISRGVEAAGTDYLEQLNNIDSRVTYVDESGKVLYDNEADVENMENHGHRKEIREAELNGEGEDERMSSTLSKRPCTMRCAWTMAMFFVSPAPRNQLLRLCGSWYRRFWAYCF